MSGDLDVRALEIAMNEYFHENHLDDINEGGFTTDSFKYLLNGHLKAINKYKMNSSKEINSFFEFMKQPNQIAIIQSDIFGIENVSATDADGNSVPIKPNHSYTAIRSDEKYLHLIDVEDSEREIHIEREKVPKCFKEASAVLLK